MQREDQTDHGNGPGTKSSESAVNHLSKSVVREIRTPRSVGTGGGRPLPVTRSQGCNSPALLDPELAGVSMSTKSNRQHPVPSIHVADRLTVGMSTTCSRRRIRSSSVVKYPIAVPT